MTLGKDIQDIMAFLEANQEVIDKLQATTDDATALIEDLTAQARANKAQVAGLVETLGDTRFVTGKTPETREEQAVLLEEIEAASKNAALFADRPLLQAHYLAMRAKAYLNLAQTYDDLAARVIEFTPEEVTELQVLLHRAVLDTQGRMQVAFVVDAAVQVSKVALRIAQRVVAA